MTVFLFLKNLSCFHFLILLIFSLALSCHFHTREHIHFTPCIEYVKYIHHRHRHDHTQCLSPLHHYQADRRVAWLYDLLSSHRRTSMDRRLTYHRSDHTHHDDTHIDDRTIYPQADLTKISLPLTLSETVTLCQHQYFFAYHVMACSESTKHHKSINRSSERSLS